MKDDNNMFLMNEDKMELLMQDNTHWVALERVNYQTNKFLEYLLHLGLRSNKIRLLLHVLRLRRLKDHI